MATELSKFIPNYVLVKFIFVFNYHPGIINGESEARFLCSLNPVCILLTVKPIICNGPLCRILRAMNPLLGKTNNNNITVFQGIKSEKVSENPDSINLHFDMLLKIFFLRISHLTIHNPVISSFIYLFFLHPLMTI